MTPKERAAMQQALGSLLAFKYNFPDAWELSDEQAITALREALEQPSSQDPFGYFCDWGSDSYGLQNIAMYYGEPGSATYDEWDESPKVYKNLPLYTTPQPVKEVELLNVIASIAHCGGLINMTVDDALTTIRGATSNYFNKDLMDDEHRDIIRNHMRKQK